MLNLKNVAKTAVLQLEVDTLIEKGNAHAVRVHERIKLLRERTLKDTHALNKIQVVDLGVVRKNVKIAEVMLTKSLEKLSKEYVSKELLQHIDLCLKTCADYRRTITQGIKMDVARLRLLDKIYKRNIKILKLKNSKYLKRVLQMIRQKQKQQLSLPSFTYNS